MPTRHCHAVIIADPWENCAICGFLVSALYTRTAPLTLNGRWMPYNRRMRNEAAHLAWRARVSERSGWTRWRARGPSRFPLSRRSGCGSATGEVR